MPPPRVLIVEDRAPFVDTLTAALEREGFVVDVASDIVGAITAFDALPPDVVLVDALLPNHSGIDLCRELRTRSDVPIVSVTPATTAIDVVIALDLGVDDYLAKPYRLRELVARMCAVARRNQMATLDLSEVVEVGDVRLDTGRHEVSVAGHVVALPLKEFELLELLLTNAGRVLTRDTIFDRVWGPGFVGDTKTLDVHIKRLRGKIEPDPANPVRITTVRGVGYRFESNGHGPPAPPAPG